MVLMIFRLPLVLKNFNLTIYCIELLRLILGKIVSCPGSSVLKFSRNNYELLNEITINPGHNLGKRNIQLQKI